jgi:fructose-specific phosphotransferase system IIC component
MKQFKVFALLVVTVGFCALVGSVIGAALTHRALFAGGYLGGLLGSYGAAWLARRLSLIPVGATKATAIGTAIGFLLAATIALNTLHSPVGPILSTLLIGVGGMVGSRFAGAGV